jgi:hypothetical protein
VYQRTLRTDMDVYKVYNVQYYNHRDRYTRVTADREIETEVRDVDRIRIRKVYASCPGRHLGGNKSSPVRHKYMLYPAAFSSPLINEDLQGEAAACVYNR